MSIFRRPAEAHGVADDGFVRVRGAREHNLKNVDVDIPRDSVVVFTGVSGSGKSSLAFGTIFAEAQRRYLDSVAPYARRLIDQAGAPAFDSITGLPPAVALQQQRGAPGARSSVGSVTSIANLVRMLYSRAGVYPPGQAMLFAEDFSPNTPQGACPICQGLGCIYDATEKLMVPDDRLTIRERAIAAWPPAWQGQNLRDICVSLGINVDIPWNRLPRKQRDWILFTHEQPTVSVYAGFTPDETRAALRRKSEPSYQGTFMSAQKYVLHTFATTQSHMMRRRVGRFLIGAACQECHGKRLTLQALAVTFAGYDIGELSQMPLARLEELFQPVADGKFACLTTPRVAGSVTGARSVARCGHAGAKDIHRTPPLSPEKLIAAQRIAKDLVERVRTLSALGLGYLSLERSTPTLSPGELQRLRLGTQLRSQLFGVVYVLDEPSAGLHPADNEALLAAFQQLRAIGNTVFVVEHDLAVMRDADWLVDVGPAAGELGGEVLYSGPPTGLRTVATSQTARYLFKEKSAITPVPRTARGWLSVQGISRNNLRDLAVEIPLGVLVAVTGISGSGKSSLVSQALIDLVSAHVGHEAPVIEDDEVDESSPETETSGRIVAGAEHIRRLVRVDQLPIGRTPRSNLATYTGLFDQVRRLFASTTEARAKKFDAGRFSFNVIKGRCPTCEGQGAVSVELLFMASAYAPCPTCHGARYNEQTLTVHYRGKTIAEVLHLTVDAALVFFEDDEAVAKPLRLLQAIGLGYLRLGQPATELSGGEAQRIKLATELQRVHHGDTLYVLDEPTTGLHPADVDRLLVQLDSLVSEGNTVVVVEHDMAVVAHCDWIIDMGPGAGGDGGHVVVSGTPQRVADSDVGRTSGYLKAFLTGLDSIKRLSV